MQVDLQVYLYHIVLCDAIYTNVLCFNLLSHELTPKCQYVTTYWHILIAMLTELMRKSF